MTSAAMLDLAGERPRWLPLHLPPPGESEVLVEIHYIGVNRGEIAQLDGSHVPAAGGSPVAGLECSGYVTATGPGVRNLAVGQPVGCLVPGGAYATHLLTHEVNIFPVPPSVPVEQAAATLESLVTAWEAVVRRARVAPGEVVLVTGAAGGVGMAAISVARHAGALPLAVCGSEWKAAACRTAGATAVVVGYEVDAIKQHLADKLGREGADVIIEVRGGDSVAADLELLAPDGRIVLLGRLEGSEIRFDLARLNLRRATVMGFNLKQRQLQERRALFDEIRATVWPHAITDGWLQLPYRADCVCRSRVVHDEIRARLRTGSSVLQATGACGRPDCPGRPSDVRHP